MAKLGYTSTPEAYPSQDFEPIPAGQYQAVVTQSELKANKKGTGHYVQLQWQIIEPGQWCNRVIFSTHNIFNQNPDAENIARRELQAFANAMHVEGFEETEQLHGKPVMVRIVIETDKTGQFAPKNAIKGASSMRPTQASPSNTSPNRGFATTGAKSVGTMPKGDAFPGDIPAAVASQATGANGGGKRAAMGNTRSNPFAE